MRGSCTRRCRGAASRRTTRYIRSAASFDTLLAGAGRDVVRNDRQLAFLLSQLRQLGASGFVHAQAQASGPRAPADPTDRVENALEFLRNWASFNFPRALTALERIQAEVFGRLGLFAGSYAPFARRVENLMLACARGARRIWTAAAACRAARTDVA